MTRKDVAKLIKRFLITFVCVLPIFIAIGYFLSGKISDFVMIVMFVVVGGSAFALEELIYYKQYQKRQILKDKNNFKQDDNKKEKK